jgi:hypothetical protein
VYVCVCVCVCVCERERERERERQTEREREDLFALIGGNFGTQAPRNSSRELCACETSATR